MWKLRNALLLILLCSPAFAQTTGKAFILDLGQGRYLGIVTTADGQTVLISDVTIQTINPPLPPSPTVTWQVEGLHVLIVDNENLRGNLPQSQVNIFSSQPLRDWLNQHAKAYRFSSNDSLRPGEPARELERAEFVDGWDLVAAGEVDLPVLLVSNGRKQTLEPLPESVDALIARLEEFR